MKYLSQRARSLMLYSDAAEYSTDTRSVALNTTLSPYPPSPAAVQAAQQMQMEHLNRYPDPDSTELTRAIAANFGLDPSNVCITNGAEEALSLCIPACFDAGQVVAVGTDTNRFLRSVLHLNSVVCKTCGLPEDLRPRAEDYTDLAVDGLILSNPHYPTGTPIGRNDMLAVVRANLDRVVILDERYAEFGNTSLAAFVNDCPNLIVIRTFSKAYGLAGLRCGYALAHPDLIEGLRNVKRSLGQYPMDTFTQTVAAAAIRDKAYLAKTVHAIVTMREEVAERLREMHCEVLPSDANFLLVRPPHLPASEVVYQLQENGIRVKHHKVPMLDEYFCVTIGTDEEMQTLLQALRRIRI